MERARALDRESCAPVTIEGIKVGLVNRVGEGSLPKGDVHLFHGEPVWFPGGFSQVCEGRGSVYGCSQDTTQDPLDDGARLG